jgi:hypothetical protein
MTEANEPDAKPDTGAEDRDTGGADSLEGEGGEGARNAGTTPPIGEEGEHGQTSAPAPEGEAETGEDTRFEE